MEGILNHGLQALYKLYISCSTWWTMIRICGRVNLSTSCESIAIQAFASPILRLGCDDPCSLFVILGQKESSYLKHLCVTQYAFLFRNIQWGPILVTSIAGYRPNFFAFSSRRDFPLKLHHGMERNWKWTISAKLPCFDKPGWESSSNV